MQVVSIAPHEAGPAVTRALAGGTADTPEQVLLVGLGADDRAIAGPLRAALERLPDLLRGGAGAGMEARIESLLRLLLPDDPMAEAHRAIALDNAVARERFLRENPCLTSAQVAAAAGHTARNASVTASRWKQQGRIFSVPAQGRDLFPAFQFRDGAPHPTVAAVLAALPAGRGPWAIAFWFTSGNGWLDGAAPAALLDQPGGVIEAARRSAEPVIG
jgi:hypothetical protein